MTAVNVNAAIVRLALTQANTFTYAQGRELGATPPMFARRVRTGQWRRELPGVYALAGTEPTYEQRLWVAVLAAGRQATVSFEAAAALHGFLGFPAGPLVVTVAHSGFARLPGITVHQITDLSDEARTTHDRLPITTPARTFVDLAATHVAGSACAWLSMTPGQRRRSRSTRSQVRSELWLGPASRASVRSDPSSTSSALGPSLRRAGSSSTCMPWWSRQLCPRSSPSTPFRGGRS